VSCVLRASFDRLLLLLPAACCLLLDWTHLECLDKAPTPVFLTCMKTIARNCDESFAS
jgi:hypothetical protein